MLKEDFDTLVPVTSPLDGLNRRQFVVPHGGGHRFCRRRAAGGGTDGGEDRQPAAW